MTKTLTNYTVSNLTAKALEAYQLESDLYDAIFNMLLEFNKECCKGDPDKLTEEQMATDVYPYISKIEQFIKTFLYDNIEANISKPDFTEV